MEPEEHQQALSEGFGQAAAAVSTLVGVLFASLVLGLSVVLAWRYRDELVAVLNRTLALRIRQPGWSAEAARSGLGVEWFRWAVAYPLAVATLVAGLVAGVLRLDGGYRGRPPRFWCLTPVAVERLLWVWSGCREGCGCPAAVRAFAVGQSLGTWYGRLVVRIVARHQLSGRGR